MRLVLSWLREFVDVKASAAEIAETLGVRGFEVAAVETLDDDAVIDFEITANRPDCLSVLGLAREVATAYDLPVIVPEANPGARAPLIKLPAVAPARSARLAVAIEDEELCPRYAAAVADVRPAATPEWMTRRLLAAGTRPISAVVDITNYVNLELGQPMHAFDLETLAGPEIRVRRARQGEGIRTLDGVDRQLDLDMLVIADRDRAQAVAGVMGGAASEVSDFTSTIVLESAYFKPASVRKTSKRLGLKTEASTRFERGADIGAQVTAIQRAGALLHQIGAGRIVEPVIDCYPHPRGQERIQLRRDRLAKLLGAQVPDTDVERILRTLGLSVEGVPGGWAIVPPTFRVDLRREADLIEEVGRHYGFDRLEPTFPPVTKPTSPPDARIVRDRLVRRVLTAAGASEVVTFGFIEASTAALFTGSNDGGSDGNGGNEKRAIAIANPLSAKFDTLRPLLLPGVIDAIGHNRRHGRRDVYVFEIGARFSRRSETRAVALAWTGATAVEHWSGDARSVDFFDVKGIAEHLCGVLGTSVRAQPTQEPYLTAGRSATIVAASGQMAGQPLGVVGQLQPAIADARGLPRQDPVFVAELDLDAIESTRTVATVAAAPLPRFPFVVRDLTIVVSNSLPAEIIRGTIQAASATIPAPLVTIGFFARYHGAGVPEGKVSLSLRLTFQASDRTLTDGEVQRSFDTILAALARDHDAVQR